jgi:hypothetical protein
MNGLILLDTFPIYSRCSFTKANVKGDAEAWLESNALQLATFLFSVCHVVIVVTDKAIDRHLWSLLARAERAKPIDSFMPKLVFCRVNKGGGREMTSDLVKESTREFNLAFQESRLGVKGGLGIGAVYPDLGGDAESNVWFIPDKRKAVTGIENLTIDSSTSTRFVLTLKVQALFDNLKQLPDDYIGMTNNFVNQILSMQRWYVQMTPIVDKVLWESRKWYQISERDWFKSAIVCASNLCASKRGGSPPRGTRQGVGSPPRGTLNSSPKRKPPRKRREEK